MPFLALAGVHYKCSPRQDGLFLECLGEALNWETGWVSTKSLTTSLSNDILCKLVAHTIHDDAWEDALINIVTVE